jgi:hypothetical protein
MSATSWNGVELSKAFLLFATLMSGRSVPLPYELITIGSCSDRPDLFQPGSASCQVSPFLSTIQSGEPLRRRDAPFASVFTGDDADNPLFVSLPSDALT